MINRWQETFAITEFTNAEMIEELLDEAGVFAEQLRNYDMQMTLGRLVNHINARVEMLRPASKVGDEGAPNGVFGVSASMTYPGMVTRYVFKKEGDTWRILYEDRETTIIDSKGMGYIRFLLNNRGDEKECVEIERKCNQKERDLRDTDESLFADEDIHVGELDVNAMDKREIRESVAAARGLISQYERDLDSTTDPSEQAELRMKIEKCRKYIGMNTNLSRDVRPSGPLEQARKRVSAAINTAKQKIADKDDAIGKHFQKAITPRGTAFVYEPDRNLTWSSM